MQSKLFIFDTSRSKFFIKWYILPRCSVINHNPICTCFDGYKGDPFYSCQIAEGMFKWTIKRKNIMLLQKHGNNYWDDCMSAHYKS